MKPQGIGRRVKIGVRERVGISSCWYTEGLTDPCDICCPSRKRCRRILLTIANSRFGVSDHPQRPASEVARDVFTNARSRSSEFDHCETQNRYSSAASSSRLKLREYRTCWRRL